MMDLVTRMIWGFYSYDGGRGSGNFGHAGRPGQIGGSTANNLTFEEAKAKLTLNKCRTSSGWSELNLKKHFGSGKKSDHSSEYPGWSQDQYRDWSILLLENEPDGVRLLGFETDELVYRHFKPTNDFAIEGKKTKIITMFKPVKRTAYFHGEARKIHRGK